MMRIKDIPSLEKKFTSYPTFAENFKRRDYFLAACKGINSHIDLYDIKVKYPSGGLIAADDSRLGCIFSQKFCGCMQCFTMHPVSWRDSVMRDPVTFTFWEQTLQNY